MTVQVETAERTRRVRAQGVAPQRRGVVDHLVLMKPRVMSLVVFTGFVGYVLVPGAIDWLRLLTTLTAMAAGAGACGALNMWWDADIDRAMSRTAMRPIPRGAVRGREALILGAMMGVASIAAMGFLVNWLAAFLLALTVAIYIPLYTMVLKRATPQNIVIGGAAGALPPMIGWAASAGQLTVGSIALFLFIFLWTPPHFWALALCRAGDYERVGVPMMPNVVGPVKTCRQILAYSLLLVASSFGAMLIPGVGLLYAAVAAVCGAIFLQRAFALFSLREAEEGPRRKAAMALFHFSILYMFLLFAALLAQTLVNRW